MQFRSKILSTLLIGSASIILLSGCKTFGANLNFANQNLPKTQEDAGRVYMSAYPPIPWYQIVDRLDPNFSIASAQDLLNVVIPVTSSQLNASSQAQNYSLGANFADPTSALVSEVVNIRNINADETVTEMQTETTTRNENSASNVVTGLNSTAPGQIPFPTNPAIPTTANLGVDPFLQYRNATALFQEIQLLNSYLEAEVANSDLVPYLIRTQLSVQPFARELPFDVHTELYVQKTGAKIIPLIITDNNERSAERRLANAARQLELAVSGQVQGIGVGGNAGNIDQQLKDLQAFDLNTVMLVGQSKERELNIRIGAAKTPNGEFALSARNYDVSFLVLIPKDCLLYTSPSPRD